MIAQTAWSPRGFRRCDAYAGMAVGEERVTEYAEGRTALVELRSLQDGRLWSFTRSAQNPNQYILKRRA